MLDRFNVTVPISRSWFYALPSPVLAPWGSALDTQSWSCRLGLYYIGILLQVLLGGLSAAIITSPGSSPSPSFSMEAPSSEAWSGTSGSATVAQEGILRSKAAAAAPQEPTNSACACVKRHAVTDNVNQLVSTGLTKKGSKVTGEVYFAKVGMRSLHLIKKGNVVRPSTWKGYGR
jgi:hypothetical protein